MPGSGGGENREKPVWKPKGHGHTCSDRSLFPLLATSTIPISNLPSTWGLQPSGAGTGGVILSVTPCAVTEATTERRTGS